MDITPLISSDNKVIQSVRGDAVKVNGEWVALPVIITPTAILEWDGTGWDDLSGEVILMGTGESFCFPDKTLRDKAKSESKAMEWMDNRAAARSYNVLMAEGRHVIAAFTV